MAGPKTKVVKKKTKPVARKPAVAVPKKKVSVKAGAPTVKHMEEFKTSAKFILAKAALVGKRSLKPLEIKKVSESAEKMLRAWWKGLKTKEKLNVLKTADKLISSLNTLEKYLALKGIVLSSVGVLHRELVKNRAQVKLSGKLPVAAIRAGKVFDLVKGARPPIRRIDVPMPDLVYNHIILGRKETHPTVVLPDINRETVSLFNYATNPTNAARQFLGRLGNLIFWKETDKLGTTDAKNMAKDLATDLQSLVNAGKLTETNSPGIGQIIQDLQSGNPDRMKRAIDRLLTVATPLSSAYAHLSDIWVASFERDSMVLFSIYGTLRLRFKENYKKLARWLQSKDAAVLAPKVLEAMIFVGYKWLNIAGQLSGYRIDPSTGKLVPKGTVPLTGMGHVAEAGAGMRIAAAATKRVAAVIDLYVVGSYEWLKVAGTAPTIAGPKKVTLKPSRFAMAVYGADINFVGKSIKQVPPIKLTFASIGLKNPYVAFTIGAPAVKRRNWSFTLWVNTNYLYIPKEKHKFGGVLTPTFSIALPKRRQFNIFPAIGTDVWMTHKGRAEKVTLDGSLGASVKLNKWLTLFAKFGTRKDFMLRTGALPITSSAKRMFYGMAGATVNFDIKSKVGGR